MTELSVVIPVFNEEQNIFPLYKALCVALEGIRHELIFVDDGSTDKTRDCISQIPDEKVLLIGLRRNFGQSAALKAGIDHAQGKFIVTIDGDLQNDPSDIPQMLAMLKQGKWDLVAGNRRKRKDGFLLRRVPSIVANALIRLLTGSRVRDYGCTLKIFTRETARRIPLTNGMHRFIPLLAERMGARVTQSGVRHHPRTYGKSKYGLERTFKVISDLFKLLNEKNRTALDIRKPYELEIACHPAVSLNPDTVEAQAV